MRCLPIHPVINTKARPSYPNLPKSELHALILFLLACRAVHHVPVRGRQLSRLVAYILRWPLPLMPTLAHFSEASAKNLRLTYGFLPVI